jgi:hypothetical protein
MGVGVGGGGTFFGVLFCSEVKVFSFFCLVFVNFPFFFPLIFLLSFFIFNLVL